MTYLAFECLCAYAWLDKPYIRAGQNLFIVLNHIRPNLSSQLAVTELDPFYVDSRLPACRAWLQEHWEDQNATI